MKIPALLVLVFCNYAVYGQTAFGYTSHARPSFVSIEKPLGWLAHAYGKITGAKSIQKKLASLKLSSLFSETTSITKELMNRGLKSTPELVALIDQCTHLIIQGNTESLLGIMKREQSTRTSAAVQTNSSPLKKLLSHVNPHTISAQLISLIQQKQPTLVKNTVSLTKLIFKKDLLEAWSCTRQALMTQESREQELERQVQAHLALKIAHHQAVDKVIQTLFILFSPHAHSCERMKALFLLNRMHLLGRKERILKEFIAYSNRHYFTAEGMLKQYDPSGSNHVDPVRLKELTDFLKMVSKNQAPYLSYLKKGISLGITGLTDIYFHDQQAYWHERKESYFLKYTVGIVKEMTGYDVSKYHTIDQALVNRNNKDLINLITTLEIEHINSPEGQTALAHAQQIIRQKALRHENHHCMATRDMEKYYQTTLAILSGI